MTFTSKSATLIKENGLNKRINEIEKIIEKERIVLNEISVKKETKKFYIWYDPDNVYNKKLCNFIRLSECFNDDSVIVNAEAVIICNVILDKHIKLLIKARNYGVKTIYVNQNICPNKWIWLFDICLVGNYNSSQLWREL